LFKLLSPVGFVYNTQYQAVAKDGYYFTVIYPDANNSGGQIIANPVVPGSTGMVRLTADLNGKILSQMLHPDAEKNRAAMFAEVQRNGLKVIASLGARAQRYVPSLDNFLRKDYIDEAFYSFNTNQDDVLTVAELQNATVTLDNQQISLSAIIAPLSLGAGGEDVSSLPGVLLSDVEKPDCSCLK
jgi:hypothetical protein